jgi:hypothetical protein
MKDQDILDGAPEGATHWDEEYEDYWIMDRYATLVFSSHSSEFEESHISSDFLRSISDIQTNITQAARIAELEKERDELKSKLKEYSDIYFTCNCRPSEMEYESFGICPACGDCICTCPVFKLEVVRESPYQPTRLDSFVMVLMPALIAKYEHDQDGFIIREAILLAKAAIKEIDND